MTPDRPGAPRIDVVGLGPAGPELITAGALDLMATAGQVFVRTRRHPSAAGLDEAASFDHHYEQGDTFEDVYRSIVADLIAAATAGDAAGTVVYAVPGSPSVAERTVGLLREDPAVRDGEVELRVHPSVSFLDLAFDRLGVDPVSVGVRLVDGETFAVDAAGERGPLVVAQCWSPSVLSDIKLSVESSPDEPVTVLHHLGLADEAVFEVAWDELDRSFTPDHLTSLWIPHLAAPVGAELLRLDELVHILRRRCPWDRQQTHGSLSRHLLEESYEVLEAIDEVAAVDGGGVVDGAADAGAEPVAEDEAVAHLEEELGDLLFQVYFHATLAAEAGRFTLADVARGVHDKLVSRHPHVFGDVTADTPEAVAANWEARKLVEKSRSSVTEGIPAALPALAVAAKLQRKALAVGMVLPGVTDDVTQLSEGLARLEHDAAVGAGSAGAGTDGAGGRPEHDTEIGELLFALVNVARRLGVDPETALRRRAARFRLAVEGRG
jgi:tetrapyrrole methylase family protein/MazG family protein